MRCRKKKKVLFKKIQPTGCICVGKKRIISEICGCINKKCDFNEWECIRCNAKKRYRSWIIFHIEHNHNRINKKSS
jgi:hypothetical protein